MHKNTIIGFVFLTTNFLLFYFLIAPLTYLIKNQHNLTVATVSIMICAFSLLLRIRFGKLDDYNKENSNYIKKMVVLLEYKEGNRNLDFEEEYKLDKRFRTIDKLSLEILEDLKNNKEIGQISYRGDIVAYKTQTHLIWKNTFIDIVDNKKWIFQYLTDYLILLGLTFFTINYIPTEYLIFLMYPIFFLPIYYCFKYLNLITEWKHKVEKESAGG